MPTLKIASVLKDASKITLEDASTYSSPARNTFYSVFYAFKVDALDNTTPLVVEGQGDQNAATQWVVVSPVDGYHRFQLLLYKVWTATAFTTGDLVERNAILYIALTDNSNDPELTIDADWAVHVGTEADADVSNVDAVLLNCVTFYRLKTCYAKEVAAAASIACHCDIDKKPLEIQRYERLALLLDGIAVDNYQTRYGEGEKKVLYTTKIC